MSLNVDFFPTNDINDSFTITQIVYMFASKLFGKKLRRICERHSDQSPERTHVDTVLY